MSEELGSVRNKCSCETVANSRLLKMENQLKVCSMFMILISTLSFVAMESAVSIFIYIININVKC